MKYFVHENDWSVFVCGFAGFGTGGGGSEFGDHDAAFDAGFQFHAYGV
jgi:hypothetical protein